MASLCSRALRVALMVASGAFAGFFACVCAIAADAPKTLLLLPVASGTPGQEWSAKALGGILADAFGSLRSVRLVTGAAREAALREFGADTAVTPESFRDICVRAGADLAVLGGSTFVTGLLALEIRVFDVQAARELQTFRGDEPAERAFELAAAAVRHIQAESGLASEEVLFPRGGTVSLEAYAAYRLSLLEESPEARIEQLRAVLKLDADYLDATLRLGVELFRQNALDEALVFLERSVALGPKVEEARNNYGVALAAAGRPEPAQREFEAAVALAPNYGEARLNLARVLEDRGRTAEAEKQYTAVLGSDAGNDKARFGLAVLYDRTGRPELAIREYRLLSPRRPDLAEEEFMRAGQEARKAREYARAEKYFLRAADINPQFAQAWAELGTNSYLAGEYTKGVEHFRKALAIEPGQGAYHYYLGLALEKGREPVEAQREYRRAVELGGPPEARFGLASAALESGDPGLAVEELNRLLALSPDHADAKTLLARATAEMESRRRLLEGQSQFANQRLARLEQIVADAGRANRELEARLQAAIRDKQLLEQQVRQERQPEPAVVDVPPVEAVPEPREAIAPLPEAPNPERAGAEAADGECTRLQGELAAEREARRAEAGRLQGELAAEREAHRVESDRARACLTDSDAVRGELAKMVSETAELKGRLAAAESGASRAEEAQRSERERGERALAAEREACRVEGAKIAAELAAERARAQDRDRLALELAAEQARTRAEAAGREKAERALVELRTSSERAIAAERERGQLAVASEREERHRESAARSAKTQTELALLAERERALGKARQDVFELALELGRIALRTQSWEKARVYLEQAADVDPHSGEAWYGLGEVYFQLGQYEKSKQMYQKASAIY